MQYLNFSCDASSLGLFDDNNDDDDSNEALLAFDGFILGTVGSFWAIVSLYGPLWAILSHLGIITELTIDYFGLLLGTSYFYRASSSYHDCCRKIAVRLP